MRQFVVLAHELTASGAADLNLDDLPGTGRLDLLARCVTSGLLLSYDIREDVRVYLVADGYVVRLEGSELRGINPDERSTAARIRDAFAAREGAIGAMAATPSPGVSIKRGDIEAVLDDLGASTLVELHSDGRPIVDLEPPENAAFVLSDHRDFTDEETNLLEERADERVSIGPRILHADQTITVAHNYLDTNGYRDY
ncbi:MAG: tRNA (pseudouridine(54)-N(1))-methyltransferase TrmY [Halobacteriota archaeon]|uniref:tRNA (pseudouridine(54)-N(1))-methyltransferase TrmY n=1 Tax=Natronomonas sp. TaxID=2184060 RepID=UPI003976CD05